MKQQPTFGFARAGVAGLFGNYTAKNDREVFVPLAKDARLHTVHPRASAPVAKP